MGPVEPLALGPGPGTRGPGPPGRRHRNGRGPLWALESPWIAATGGEGDLKRALAGLWRVEDGLRRAIAAFAEETEDPAVRRRAGLPAPPARRGTRVPLIAVIRSATLRAHGRVELAIECPMLGVARGLHVQVRRRVGARGVYAPIAITLEPIFLDERAHEGGEAAAYKVVAVRHGNRGPLSDRVVVPIPRRAAPTGATTLRREHRRPAA